MRLLLILSVCLAFGSLALGSGSVAHAGSACNPNIQSCP
jgi:hypothetical protein